MNIKWLFFDVGTTLVDEEKAYDHRVLDIIKDTNISFEEFDNKRIELAKRGLDGNSAAIKHFNLIKTPWHSEDEYSGGIVKLLDSALNFVKKNTKKKWKKIATGRVEMPEYDEIAIREVIVNAIIHRQYTNVGFEVTIDIYDDRIVVTSPGPMPSG